MNDAHAHQKQLFLEAYSQHADAIFRYCFFRIGDRERAQDLVQDIFMRVWNYMSTGKEIANIKSFVYTTASHAVIDEYRARKPQDSLEKISEDSGWEPTADDANLIDKMDGEHALELLHYLPDSYNEAIFLRYVQELTLSEMSELLGESENAISVRVHRGIEMLRKIWRHDDKK